MFHLQSCWAKKSIHIYNSVITFSRYSLHPLYFNAWICLCQNILQHLWCDTLWWQCDRPSLFKHTHMPLLCVVTNIKSPRLDCPLIYLAHSNLDSLRPSDAIWRQILVIIGSGNGLLSVRCQAIVWVNDDIDGTNLCEILIKIHWASITILSLRQNGWLFADNIFKWIFFIFNLIMNSIYQNVFLLF